MPGLKFFRYRLPNQRLANGLLAPLTTICTTCTTATIMGCILLFGMCGWAQSTKVMHSGFCSILSLSFQRKIRICLHELILEQNRLESGAGRIFLSEVKLSPSKRKNKAKNETSVAFLFKFESISIQSLPV